MGEATKIEWAHDTFNPWWGCTKVSAGCENCYAESLAKRYGHGIWGPNAGRRVLSDAHWRKPLKWNREAEASGEPRRVFCGSMCDVFEDRLDLERIRSRLVALIESTPYLTWMLLTKRPENVVGLIQRCSLWADTNWPGNVWVGTSVEDQRSADERIPHLLRVPARVRFLSMEPLIDPVVLDWCGECGGHGLGMHGSGEPDKYGDERECGPSKEFPPVDWVIVGGESGGGSRPMDPDWARSIRDQCEAAGVPFLFKQWGAHGSDLVRLGKKKTGRELDGRTWDDFPPHQRIL